VVLVTLAIAAPADAGRARGYPIPAWFVPQALCVHSGWHWSPHRQRPGQRPEYRIAGRWWFRTVDVPDSISGGSGEGAWTAASGLYGGGLQLMLGTYNRAAGLSHGRLPVLSSNAQVAALSPAAQMYAAYLIVRQDRGRWSEWPWTGRACGLPQ
jgi:hypothetical protein